MEGGGCILKSFIAYNVFYKMEEVKFWFWKAVTLEARIFLVLKNILSEYLFSLCRQYQYKPQDELGWSGQVQ